MPRSAGDRTNAHSRAQVLEARTRGPRRVDRSALIVAFGVACAQGRPRNSVRSRVRLYDTFPARAGAFLTVRSGWSPVRTFPADGKGAFKAGCAAGAFVLAPTEVACTGSSPRATQRAGQMTLRATGDHSTIPPARRSRPGRSRPVGDPPAVALTRLPARTRCPRVYCSGARIEGGGALVLAQGRAGAWPHALVPSARDFVGSWKLLPGPAHRCAGIPA